MIIYLIGFFSGIISGMGIGGGVILIPAYVIFLNVEQHLIQGVNLLYFIPTALAALIIHAQNKFIDLKTAWGIIFFGIIGSAVGGIIAVTLPSLYLRKMFGIFLFFMGLYEFFKKPSKINTG